MTNPPTLPTVQPLLPPSMPPLPAAARTLRHLRVSPGRLIGAKAVPMLNDDEQRQLAAAIRYARALDDALARGTVPAPQQGEARAIVRRSRDWEELLVLSVMPALRSEVARSRKKADATVQEDVDQACRIAAVQAIRTFDPAKGRLVPWCRTRLKQERAAVRATMYGDRISRQDNRVVSLAVQIKDSRGLRDAALQQAVRDALIEDLREGARVRGVEMSDEQAAARMKRRGYDRAIGELDLLLAENKRRPQALDAPIGSADDGSPAYLHDQVASPEPGPDELVVGGMDGQVRQLAFDGTDPAMAQALLDRVAAGDERGGVSSTRRVAAETSFKERDLNAALSDAQSRVTSPVLQYCYLAGAVATAFVDEDELANPVAAWAGR